MVPEMSFRTIVGSVKNLFGLVFRNFSRGLKKSPLLNLRKWFKEI